MGWGWKKWKKRKKGKRVEVPSERVGEGDRRTVCASAST